MSESNADPIAPAVADERTTLTEAEAKRLLADAGVETTTFEVATNSAEAVDAAKRIGFPVVVKVSSPAVTHKSDWADGTGVALGLDGPDVVAEAATAILEAADDRGINADLLVESAVDLDAGTEVIVGGTNDPSFGPVTLVGLGGVFAEVYEDVAHRVAPVTEREARDAVESLTAAPLLSGYRSRPAGDVDALVDAVRAVGDLLVAHPEIVEIDVNPILVGPNGAIALDGLVVLEGDD